ncbi:hypothetical protein OAU99_01620 [Candidatus Poseidoniaceae archaeon]|nr:hypothetical protein [Candidatus Poseidoniaceae archaeon]
MESNIHKSLISVQNVLDNSRNSYSFISDYLNSLENDIFLLESVFEDSIATLARVLIDSIYCESEFQIEKNRELRSLTNKLELLLKDSIPTDQLLLTFSPVSKLHSSLFDNNGAGKSSRPIEGIIPKSFTDLENQLLEHIVSYVPPCNWQEWLTLIERHLEIINAIVRVFPPSHSFGSIPCSISMVLGRIRCIIEEQEKMKRTLDILAQHDDRGHIFHLDTLLIRQRLLPVPVASEGE